jgi:hypothetical protein
LKVHTSGLWHPLAGDDLETSTRGVHNEATSNDVKINHNGGDLLVIWQVD